MRETWLTPLAAVWRGAYPSAEVPWKQLAQALRPLVKAHPTERVVGELRGYLQQTPAQFLNLRKFTATFGSWDRPAPRAAKPYYQTPDEMDRKAGILP